MIRRALHLTLAVQPPLPPLPPPPTSAAATAADAAATLTAAALGIANTAASPCPPAQALLVAGERAWAAWVLTQARRLRGLSRAELGGLLAGRSLPREGARKQDLVGRLLQHARHLHGNV